LESYYCIMTNLHLFYAKWIFNSNTLIFQKQLQYNFPIIKANI
jgi:hypothetical protein